MPGDFPLFSYTHRISQEQALQLAEHFFGRLAASQQRDDLVFNGMQTHCAIDLHGLLALSALVRQLRFRALAEDAFEIAQKHGGVKILANGFLGLAAPVLQFQTPL